MAKPPTAFKSRQERNRRLAGEDTRGASENKDVQHHPSMGRGSRHRATGLTPNRPAVTETMETSKRRPRCGGTAAGAAGGTQGEVPESQTWNAAAATRLTTAGSWHKPGAHPWTRGHRGPSLSLSPEGSSDPGYCMDRQTMSGESQYTGTHRMTPCACGRVHRRESRVGGARDRPGSWCSMGTELLLRGMRTFRTWAVSMLNATELDT